MARMKEPARFGLVEPAPEYMPLAIERIDPGSAVPFDLYVKEGERYVLFRSARLPLSREDVEALIRRRQRTFFVPSGAQTALARFLEVDLARRLKDPAVPIDTKAHFLVEASRVIMRDLFEQPESPEGLVRVRSLVEQTVGFVTSGRDAFRNVVKLCSHDYYTYTHSLHVGTYSIAIGRQLGLSEPFLRRLGEGAFLHDVGKALVPPEILTKPARLEPEEWAVMRQHPRFGIDLLETHGPVDEVTRWAVLGHHERMDGKGYPHGVAGEEIPLAGRIVALADIYDALTTNRSYQAALKSFDALNLIRSQIIDGIDTDLFRELVVLLARDDADW